MKTNKEYKDEALDALSGNWSQAILAAFAVMVVSELTYAMAWGLDRLSVSSIVLRSFPASTGCCWNDKFI